MNNRSGKIYGPAGLIALSALFVVMQATAPMIELPAGSYRPLYGNAGDPPTQVDGFRLDRDPVTRGDYLHFVRTHREWRRSAVRGLFADRRARV